MLPHYPRTYHLEGSRVPPGHVNPEAVPFKEVVGQHLVIEEKLDGSHAGLFFDGGADLRVFSRNTILTLENADKSFRPLLHWAALYMDDLWDVLGTRYVLYGEWCCVVHTIQYERLPSWFMEDDIFDREQGVFLDTPSRRALVANLPDPFCHSVPVLGSGAYKNMDQVIPLIGPSAYGDEPMEGLYIKVEDEGAVTRRLKWVRHDFVENILMSDHWRTAMLQKGILTHNTVVGSVAPLCGVVWGRRQS